MLREMTRPLQHTPQLSALVKCNAREELDSGNLNNELVNVPLTPLFCCGKWKPVGICFTMCCHSLCPLPQFSAIRTILGQENAIDIKKKYVWISIVRQTCLSLS